jgi:hypothetical protein
VSYLATARRVVTGYERNESDEETAALTQSGVHFALLVLQDEIVAAASTARDAFDRQHFDRLWAEWHALQAEETP